MSDDSTRRSLIQADIDDAYHQMQRCLAHSKETQNGYVAKYDSLRETWLQKKRELDGADDSRRAECQKAVDDLFDEMQRMQAYKDTANEDYQLEYDKWRRVWEQKRQELEMLD